MYEQNVRILDNHSINISCTRHIPKISKIFHVINNTYLVSGISFCLYNLAAYPEYQQKCREEINDVLGEKANVEW